MLSNKLIRMRRFVVKCAVIIALIGGRSFAQGEGSQEAPPSAAPSSDLAPITGAGYRITPGDVVAIQVYGRPQLQREGMRVEADGTIRLPLIQDPVSIACKTEGEASAQIATAYRKFLVDPQVSVLVKEFNSLPVEVTGSVVRPSGFQLRRAVRLRELLARAGGLTPNAGASIQVIHDDSLVSCDDRQKLVSGGETEAVPFIWLDAAKVMSGTEGANPWIQPGDFINIPAADLVYVVGNVYHPSSFALTKGLTVTRAIATAGGTLAASKSYARILRPSEGVSKELQVDLHAIASGKAPDMMLEPGDIVDVPLSQGKQLLKGAVSSVTSMGPVYYPLLVVK